MAVTWLAINVSAQSPVSGTPLLSAIQARTAEKYGGSLSQGTRDAVHKSSIKLVKANLTGAERTGELSVIATGEIGNGVFLDEYIDVQDKNERAFHLLGESHRSHEGVSGRRNFYYAQMGVNLPGEVHTPTCGGGQTAGSAKWIQSDQFVSAASNAYILGPIWKIVSGTPNFGNQGNVDVEDGFNGTIKFRGDHPRFPGLITGSWAHHQANGGAAPNWTNVCGNADTWRADYITRTDFSGELSGARGWFVVPSVATQSSDDLWDQFLIPAITTASVVSSGGTILVADSSGTTGDPKEVIVHPRNGLSPGPRLTKNGFGYELEINGSSRDTSVAKTGFEIVNLSMIDGVLPAQGGSANSQSATREFTMRGGRYLQADDMKIFGRAVKHSFKASTDGRILYSTSGRVTANDPRIQELITEHSASAGHFSNMDRWVEIGYSKNGPYTVNVGNTGNPIVEVSGLWLHHIGSSGGIETKFFSYGENDMHAFGAQNATSNSYSRFYIGDPKKPRSGAGSAINIYSKADGGTSAPTVGTSQDLNDNTIRLGVIIRSNGNSASIAGFNGISINGDNDSILMANGTGVKTGNVVENVYIGEIVAISGQELGGSFVDGNAIVMNNEQPVTYRNITIENCTNDFIGGRNFTDACGRSIGSHTIGENIISRRGSNSQYLFWERAANWGGSTGVFDVSGGEVHVDTDESSATPVARFFTSPTAEQTLTSIQANTKSSVGTDASQNSHFFNAFVLVTANA